MRTERRQLDIALKQCDAEIRRNPTFAEAHLRRGSILQALQQFDEALQSYERAIGFDPGLAEAHYQKANLLRLLRRFEEAVASYERTIGANQNHVAAWDNRARALRALRRLDDALLSCDQAITLQPDTAELHLNRGNVLMELGRAGDALASYGQAISLRPDLVEAHYNRANAATQTGQIADALTGYDRAIELRPGFAEAHHARANALEKLDRLNEALEGFDRAAALKTGFAESYNNKGNVLCRLGRREEAIDSYTRAVRVSPKYALAWNNRGGALKDTGRLEEALASCDKAIAHAPGFVAAHFNRGNVLKGLKRLPEAIESFDRAIELAPDFAEAHRNKATTTLLMGNFEQGWELYERRNAGFAVPAITGSAYTGVENLEGKSLLVVAEQGFGDTFQFCRYAGLAAVRGADVTLAVQDPLVAMLKCLEPEISITGVSAVHPGFDYYIPLMSLPRALGTRGNNIPSTTPYLRADPARIQGWRSRIGASGFKIGICWQGAVGGEVDIGRSFPVSYFETLGDIPGLRLISLQKHAGSEQLEHLPAAMKVETFGKSLDPGAEAFVDTAAIMENLDLIITSDTAIAHLAGSLGRPAWVALSFVPDWRWMLDRDDSPWYPTMRLFRQAAPNGWPDVFAAMKSSLLELLSATRARA